MLNKKDKEIQELMKELNIPQNFAEHVQDEIGYQRELYKGDFHKDLLESNILGIKGEVKYLNYVGDLGFEVDYILKDSMQKNIYIEDNEIKNEFNKIIADEDCYHFRRSVYVSQEQILEYLYEKSEEHNSKINDLIQDGKISEVIDLLDNGHFIYKEQIDAAFMKTVELNDRELFGRLYESVSEQQNPDNQILHRACILSFIDDENENIQTINNSAIDYIFENKEKYTYNINERQPYDLRNWEFSESLDVNKIVATVSVFNNYPGVSNEERDKKINNSIANYDFQTPDFSNSFS